MNSGTQSHKIQSIHTLTDCYNCDWLTWVPAKMATWQTNNSAVLLLTLLLLLLLLSYSVSRAEAAAIRRRPENTPTYVYAFGDSITDTGNSPAADPVGNGDVLLPPFGMTWFHRGAGRRSDGRLIIDWLCLLAFDGGASAYAPPAELLLRAHLAPPEPLAWRRGGANYAVAGSTALDPAALWEAAEVNVTTPYALGRQVDWFREDVERGAVSEEGRTRLVYFGETGGNDVNFALAAKRPAELISRRLLPRVMEEIERQLERILAAEMGGRAAVTEVIVQGQFPMGCLAVYIRQWRLSEPLDELGCVPSINALSDLQNHLILTSLIPNVSARHPNLSFVFLDTSAAFRHVLAHAPDYGFTHFGEEACYDYNADRRACSDPSTYVSWDGIHMTDAFYGALARLFVEGNGGTTFTVPPRSFLAAMAAS